MAFDPSKKNTNSYQAPQYTNPYVPPAVPQKKSSGVGIKIAIFAIIAIFLIAAGLGMAFYFNSVNNVSDDMNNVTEQTQNNNTMVEVEIFN